MSVYNKYRHQTCSRQNHCRVVKYDWQLKAGIRSFIAMEQPNGTCLKGLNAKTWNAVWLS